MNNNLTLLRQSLAAVWLLTAIASWHYPLDLSLAMIERTGLHGTTGLAALYAAIVLDTVMGILTLVHLHRLQKWLWLTQAVVIIFYSVIIATFLPEDALHPFGMLIKNIPLLAILWILWRASRLTKGDKHV